MNTEDYDPPGTQRIIDGKTWTLARYDLAMWLPTNDIDVAQDTLSRIIAEKFDGIRQGHDPEAYVKNGTRVYERAVAKLRSLSVR